MLADVVSGEGPLPGLQMAVCLLTVSSHALFGPQREEASSLVSLLTRD